MKSVLENLWNLAEESLDPTEAFVLFALPVGGEGQIPFLPDSLDSHSEGDETELDLARSDLIWPFQCLFTKSC